MIEMLGVLAIIGVLSVGGIAGYTKAMMKYKINKATDQISQVVAGTRTLYGSQGSYGDSISNHEDFAPILKKAHVIPDEMVGTDDAVTNPWDGGFDVSSAGKKAADDNKAFTITLTGLPEQACMELATYDWGSGSSSGLISLSVGVGVSDGLLFGCSSDIISTDYVNICAANMPMSVSTAASVCSGDDSKLSLKFF